MADKWYDGFFKLPELEFLDEEPNEDQPTSGMMHGSKFKDIFEGLLNNNAFIIDEVLRGHRLQPELSKFTLNKLNDFCRHVIFINRGTIGWQKADELIAELDKIFKPSWKLPNIIFNEDFKELYSTIIRWELTPPQKSYLRELLKKNEYLDEQVYEEKLTSSYAFWNFRELSVLFDELLRLNRIAELEDQGKELLVVVERIFLDLVKDFKQPLEKRIALISNILQFYSINSNKAGTSLQDLLDRLWIKVENELSDQEISSYRYLFGINYAHISYLLYLDGIRFLDRRRIVDKIILSFTHEDSTPIEDWLDFVIQSGIDNNVVEYIIIGYNLIVNIIEEYLKELPEGEKYTRFFNIYQKLSKLIHHSTIRYFEKKFKLNLRNAKDFYGLLNSIESEQKNKKSVLRLIEIMLYSFQREVNRNDELIPQISKYSDFASQVLPSYKAELYSSTTLLLTGTYPFDTIMKNIAYESEEVGTLVISNTFEEEVLKRISIIMETLLKVAKFQDVTRDFKELLYFIAEWLNYFSRHDLFQDAIMILSPIISICFIQISQAYYQINMSEKAFLTYLDMHLFLQYVRNKMDVVGRKFEMPRKQVASEFRSMISTWDLESMLSEKEIKHKISDLELAFQTPSAAQSGMIDDDVLMGFLDRTDQIEHLLRLLHEHDEMPLEEIINAFHPPNPESLNILDQIGKINLDTEYDPLAFPILRNIDMCGAAVSIIPVELALSDSAKDSLIAGVEEFIVKQYR